MERLVDITEALDEALKNRELGNFYGIRSELKQTSAWNGALLQLRHDDQQPRSGYAFHKGGRRELQFNVGFEDDGRYFRFGVAFSFERGRSLLDPVGELRPKVDRFNAVIKSLPELADLKMWHYDHDERGPEVLVGPVPADWVRERVFVFIGQRTRVGASGVTKAVVRQAAEVLERLLPLYRMVEGNAPLPGDRAAVRVARICWNTRNWEAPSGFDGKARSGDAFEVERGYAHEEWLFDFSALIDGWKYGFIQAFNGSGSNHVGKALDLLLYTLDSKSKQRYWVGVIEGVEVLTQAEAARANRTIKGDGGLDRMIKAVETLGLVPTSLKANGPDLANVRFKPARVRLFSAPVPFDGEGLGANRYGQLMDVPASQQAMLGKGRETDVLIGANITKTGASRRVIESEGGVTLQQAEWQLALRKSLARDLAGVDVAVETKVDGHRIDIVVGAKAKRAFVELKPTGSPRQVIRAAIGQLLKYAYWPDQSRCHALLVVGPSPASGEDLAYLQMLRKRFSLPVDYLHYEGGRISGVSAWWKGLDV